MGALVTTYEYADTEGTMLLPNSCTFYTDTIIKDTLVWYKVSGSFIADSAYQYIVIGNFFDDEFLDTLNFPYEVVPQASYYYLDDVCLSTDSLFAQNWTGLAQNSFNYEFAKIYPNPATDSFFIEANNPITMIEIANATGEIIYKRRIANQTELKVFSNNFTNGLCFLKLNTKNGVFTSKIIFNH